MAIVKNKNRTQEPEHDSQRTIVYLVAIEDIIQSPIIRSQVLNLLKAISSRHTNTRITLVSLYPIANRIKLRDEINALRLELQIDNIDLCIVPILYLTRYFYIPARLYPLYWIQALIAAVWIAVRLHPDLVHCRSYPAAVSGVWIKRLTGARLIFDTRNLYPEEGVTVMRSWKATPLNDRGYKLWKKQESKLFHAADASTVVSEPTIPTLRAQYPEVSDSLYLIPQPTPISSLDQVLAWRAETRHSLNLSEDAILVAYMGSWLDMEATTALFGLLVNAAPQQDWHFLLLVSSKETKDQASQKHISEKIENALGLQHRCTTLSLPHTSVARYLAGADLAAHPLKATDQEIADPRYRLRAQAWQSIKFTEYLACGLPVISSQWIGAVATTIDQHGLGIVYDSATPDQLRDWIRQWISRRSEYRRRTWEYARAHFDIDRVVQLYSDLYEKLFELET